MTINNSIKILSIDPAGHQSGYVLSSLSADRKVSIISKGIIPTKDFISFLKDVKCDYVALEVIVPYGIPVGRTVFDTVEVIGRITQIFSDRDIPLYRISRKAVASHFKVKRAGSNADSQIAYALRMRFAQEPEVNYGKGSIGKPDFFYGFKADIWQAFAVGVYAMDKLL